MSEFSLSVPFSLSRRVSRSSLPARGAVALFVMLALGCSSPGEGGAGTGGSSGASGTGGASTSGGTSGSVGALGGTGGGDLTGGASGSGGAPAVAGAAGISGGGGSAGTTGTGGATAGTGGSNLGGSASGAGGAGGATGSMKSSGCGKTPTLKNSPSASPLNYNTITSSGSTRQYVVRWPSNYDNMRPYRLIIGLHGATGSAQEVAGNQGYFGLADLSNGSAIFVAAEANGGLWSAATDTIYIDDLLKQVEGDLCIDTRRVQLEGFSQGAAMAWTLACSRPGVFSALVGHSGGGVPNPAMCQPIPYLGSLGLKENGGQNGQRSQTDQFARWNGCTVETLPTAPTGGHVCTDYEGCSAGHPVRWCSFDGNHTPSPVDSGERTTWMPMEVWTFLSQF